MAGGKAGSVIDWHWMERQLPIAGDALSKRTRNLLFEQLDAGGEGFLHMSVVIKGFLKTIRNVRGILDLRPVWTACFRLVRAAVDPVIPIGIDFMEKNQFRVYLISIWLYLKLWEYFYFSCPRGNVVVRAHDLPAVVYILEDFGYPDARRFETFVRPYFQDANSEFPFNKFADVVLKHVLTEISEIDGEIERNNATVQIGRMHPALLHKSTIGEYKAHSMETGQPRMTGMVHKEMRKAASESALSQGLPTGPKQWTSQYAMQFTTTKFLPKARRDPLSHPCHTERDLSFSHPAYQFNHGGISAPGHESGVPLQPDISRLVFAQPSKPNNPACLRAEPPKRYQAAGITMAQKLQMLGVINNRS